MKAAFRLSAIVCLSALSVYAGRWEARLPTPLAVNLNHVIHDGEFFLATGEGGTVLVSPDGITWGRQSPDYDVSVWAKGSMYTIRKANGEWFAMGQPAPGGAGATVFFRSANRVDWSVNEFGSDRIRKDLAFGAGRYVWPINGGHFIETTTNLAGSYFFLEVNFPGSPNRILYADSKFVIVGTKGLVATSNGGTSWSVRPTEFSKELLGLKYLEGAFYAVGQGLTILRSINGTDWTRVHGDDSYTPLSDIEYFKGIFYAPSALGDEMLVSTNGIDWESRSLPGLYGISALATDQNRLVAVGAHGLLMHSTDGLEWFGMAEPARSEGFGRLASSGSTAVIFRRMSEVAWSDDGLNWRTVRLDGDVPMREIVWFKDAFLACDDYNGKMLTSPDGRSWSVLADLPMTTQSLNLRTAGERVFMSDSTGTLYSSVDGITWVTIQLSGTRQIRTAIWGNDTYLLSHYNDSWTSTDGVDFQIAPKRPNGMGDPTFHRGKFYAATGLFVFSSQDGKSWLQLSFDPFPQWFGASGMYSDGETLYLMGSRGLLASSADGIDWTFDDTELATFATNFVTLGDSVLIGFSDGEVVQRREDPPESGLANISVRGFLPTGDSVQIGGFVLEGTGARSVIARGIGPSIASSQLQAISDPLLTLFRGKTSLFVNDNWEDSSNLNSLTQRSQEVGAFALTAGFPDAAMLVDLDPGAYTAVVRSRAGDSAVGLVELFDAGSSGPGVSRIVNLSARGTVEAGANRLIAGFVVAQGRPAKVLIRGIGPGLGDFGVAGFLSEPRLQIFSDGQSLGSVESWGQLESVAALSAAMQEAGAFPLRRDSKDAALLAYLEPGAYTVHLTGLAGPGTGLIEIFLLE
ncbi:MAG: hypothetical protein R3F07_16605 [Opitutaceae bacterium]